jgi:hypothetical protein
LEGPPEDPDKQAGSRWLTVSPRSPLIHAVREVEVVPEKPRWPQAPGFFADRFVAVPHTRPVSVLQAIRMVWAQWRRPRDDFADRLGDIEEMIVQGYATAAFARIDELLGDYPGPQSSRRVLGLLALAWWDRGDADTARLYHVASLVAGSAHPAMIEIFGEDASLDLDD